MNEATLWDVLSCLLCINLGCYDFPTNCDQLLILLEKNPNKPVYYHHKDIKERTLFT